MRRYVVQPGDTLRAIAEEKLGSPEKWKVLAQLNGIDDPNELRAGQKIMIPTDDRTVPKPTHSEL